MPDTAPRRVIAEKSRTVRRRYQRSNKVFQFTPEQLQRIEREQERERRAKQLREREKKRIANKKKKSEQEARAREERKKQGLSDPGVANVTSSQPSLARFLGMKPPPPPPPLPQARRDGEGSEMASATDTTEKKEEEDKSESGGDTEVDSDAFGDWDEEIGPALCAIQDAGVLENADADLEKEKEKENHAPAKDDDEFSECSAFYDEEIIKEADAAATATGPTTDDRPATHSTINPSTAPQPPPAAAAVIASFGDSFRDETADFLEEVFSRGGADPFHELIQLDTRT
ncbi:hypothetical protein N7474_009964 [Penicillium riverlandense]|uniref:uncharacterized protein n=1 Tax=Penicillium riverlandense TaxID=1903569 RepID=UPI0025475E20|nr:uncharacterized protein N7474_009964 [Penicillium riverlandense]KAJ5808695.1 hypothetical protein N7474_009964 [Penicillium riverlandense]